MSALEHLMAHDTLSVQLLADTHAIMMQGAKLEETGAPVPRGQLRTQPVHANGRLFMDAARVPAALASACSSAMDKYNPGQDPAQEVCVHIARAARLFRDVVHDIHPFLDGNGRLGRLLIAWCLRPHVGIVLPIINGHRKPRKKYEAVISRMARTLGDSAAPMRSHILECLAYRVCCFQRVSSEFGAICNNAT
jgi:Fic family protein